MRLEIIKNMRNGIPQIEKLKALPGCKLFVSFFDGVSGIVDLSEDKGKGVFEIWNEENVFEKVYLSDHASIAWNEDVEIDVLNIYLTLTNQTFEAYARC